MNKAQEGKAQHRGHGQRHRNSVWGQMVATPVASSDVQDCCIIHPAPEATAGLCVSCTSVTKRKLAMAQTFLLLPGGPGAPSLAFRLSPRAPAPRTKTCSTHPYGYPGCLTKSAVWLGKMLRDRAPACSFLPLHL